MIRQVDLQQGEHAAVFPWMIRLCDGDAVVAVVLAHMAFRTFSGTRWHLATFADVAERTGLSVRQVERALNALREHGHVQSRRGPDKWNATQEWNLVVAPDGAREPTPAGPPENTPAGVHGGAPDGVPLDESIKEQETKQSGLQEAPAAPQRPGDLVLVAQEDPADQVNRVMADYLAWRRDFAGYGAATRRTVAGLKNTVRDTLAAGVPEDVVKQGLADWTHHGHVAASLDSFIENRSRRRVPGQQIPKQSKIRATLTEAAQGPDPAMRALFGLDPVNGDASADIVGRALPPTFGAMP